MKLKLVKASQGLVWVRQGILACRQQPLGFIGLCGMAFLLVGLPVSMGLIFNVALSPLVWMAFMLATRRVLTGQRITLSVLLEPVKGPDAPRREFVQLGASYLVLIWLATLLAQWLGPDPDAIDQLLSSTDNPAELMSNPLMQSMMLWHLGLTLPITLLYWHTPALVLWARQPVLKSVFFSAVAMWRNAGAFLVYGLGWLGVVLALGAIDTVLLTLLPDQPAIANVVGVIGTMWLGAAFYASLYFTVVDCFEPKAKE
jgi:hypothetical protein